MTIVPLGEARNHLSEVVESVDRTHDRVTITRHGQPVAVILSPTDLDGLEETIAILSSPGAVQAVQAGDRAADEGDFEDWADVRRRFARPDRTDGDS